MLQPSGCVVLAHASLGQGSRVGRRTRAQSEGSAVDQAGFEARTALERIAEPLLHLRALSGLDGHSGGDASAPSPDAGSVPALARARSSTALIQAMSADRRIVTTLDSKRTGWVARAEIIPPQYSAVRRVITLLQQAEQCFAAVLNGESRSDQMLAAILRRTRPRSRIVIADCTWKAQSSRLDGLVNRMGLRLIDSPRVVYCVLSSDEKVLFPHTWGVDSERVFFTPWCHTLTQEQLAAPTRDDGFVFAGGDSLRDYGPLVELSRRLPLRIRIATRLEPSTALPSNVTMGPVGEDEYVDLMRSASVVVVALEPARERSAGLSYLNAMAMGKLVIVTEGTGVRDYVDHGITGLIVPPGDTEALSSALQWALSPSNCSEVEKISAQAQAQVRSRFGPDNYVSSLLRVIDELPD